MKIGLAKFCNFSQLRLSNSLTYVYCVACLCVCVFFACFLVRDLCRSGCRQNYYLTPPPLPPASPDYFFPIHISFFNTSDSYLKSARA